MRDAARKEESPRRRPRTKGTPAESRSAKQEASWIGFTQPEYASALVIHVEHRTVLRAKRN